MRATCFSIAGGALGIALIGGIFPSTLERGPIGARSAQEAFVGSASNVTFYQIASSSWSLPWCPSCARSRPRARRPGPWSSKSKGF